MINSFETNFCICITSGCTFVVLVLKVVSTVVPDDFSIDCEEKKDDDLDSRNKSVLDRVRVAAEQDFLVGWVGFPHESKVQSFFGLLG